ncbi:M60 family peptidase N-terminal accessory domain-containing protein [Tenacibaculum sp. 190524A05c]|uniref:M60 family peptidase N-terminal accessory domain-containing protein n=1 Tax=Tenacibaculum platacis TaxID=3137852 RepID=UPI0032B2A647
MKQNYFKISTRLKSVYFLFLSIFFIAVSNAQISQFTFEDDINDQVGSFDGSYLLDGVETTINSTLFTSGLNGKALSLKPNEGLSLPNTLGQSILNENSFQVELDFNVTEAGTGDARKPIFNYKVSDSETSAGFNLYTEFDGTNIKLIFLYADGRQGTQGADFAYSSPVGQLTEGEWVKVNLIIDFVSRTWTIRVNDSFTVQNFDPKFDLDYVKSELSTLHPYVGWRFELETAVAAFPSTFSSTVKFDNLNIYAPKKASSVSTLTNAIDEMTKSILGTVTLTQSQKDLYTIDILLNYSNNYASAKTSIDAYLKAYEDNYAPLFQSGSLVNISDLSNESRITFYLQQDIHDNEFVLGNIDNVSGIKFEAADVFPGSIDNSAPRLVSQVVEINGTYITDRGYQRGGDTAIRPTGYYAAPGEIIEINVPSQAINSGLSIQVGSHAFDLTAKLGETNRFPRISKEFDVTQSQVKVANPFGGAIYILVPDGTNLGWLDITISNAIKSPFYRSISGHELSISSFQTDLANNYTSWIDIESEMMLFTLPKGMIGSHDISGAMNKWDEMWEAVQIAGGRPLKKTRSEYLLIDRRLPFGAIGAGYPMILSFSDAPFGNYSDSGENPLRVLETNYIQTASNGVLVHEFGHNMNFPTPPGEIETTVQLVGLPAYNVGLGLPIDTVTQYLENEMHTRDMAAINWMISQNFRTNNPMGCDPTMPNDVCDEKRYQIRGGMKFVDIAMLFGWDKLGKINEVYYNRFKSANWLAEDIPNISSEDYIKTCTEALDINITPLLHFWGYIPSQSLKDNLDSYTESTEILDRLNYYKSIIPADKNAFQTWYDLIKPTVDPVHHDRFDWTLANYDTENIAKQISDQIDFIIGYYFNNLSTDDENEKDLKIYPNPANQIIKVIAKNQSELELTLYDIHGRVVAYNDKSAELDVKQISNGTYFLRITNLEGNSIIKKVLIK